MEEIEKGLLRFAALEKPVEGKAERREMEQTDRELSVSLRIRDRAGREPRGRLGGACLRVIGGWFHSDEQYLPFQMFAGGGGPPSRKSLIQQLEVNDLIRLHQDPVGQAATTGAAYLVRQQLG